MTEFTIRPAVAADVPAILELVKASWARTYDPVIGAEAREAKSDAKHVPALFLGEIERSDAAGIVAEADGGIIGHTGGEQRGRDIFFIDHLHVDPAWYGTGVAGAILNGLRDYLSANMSAIRHVELTVLEGNDRAIGFYKKHGFVQTTGANEDEGLAGTPSLLMRWTL